MTTRHYFSACLALPIVLCLLGSAFDPTGFAPILIVGVIVYVPVAIYAWWRIRSATHLDTFRNVSAMFPFASSLLLGGVFAFPQLVGGGNGDPILAMVGFVTALIVGYAYILVVWISYSLLRKAGLVTNEFAA